MTTEPRPGLTQEIAEAIAEPIRKMQQDLKDQRKCIEELQNNQKQLREWVSHAIQDLVNGPSHTRPS